MEVLSVEREKKGNEFVVLLSQQYPYMVFVF